MVSFTAPMEKGEKMYESPIETIYENVQMQFEDAILKAVQKVGINVDRDELLKALQYDRDQYNKGYFDGWCVKDESIVRCKDCEWRDENTCLIHGAIWKDNDFCSQGERREE